MRTKILLTILLILTGIILVVRGQESNDRVEDGNASLKLTISVTENVCLGDKFSLITRLENAGEQQITVNLRQITQLLDEVSFGQGYEFPIKASRGRFSKIYDLNSPPKSFLLELKPGAFYEYKYSIDPKKDKFYRATGRYYVKLVNLQHKERMEAEAVSFESLDSNSLEFEIKDCSRTMER